MLRGEKAPELLASLSKLYTSCVCFRHTWRTPRRLLWFGGGGRTLICGLLGFSVLNWRLSRTPPVWPSGTLPLGA